MSKTVSILFILALPLINSYGQGLILSYSTEINAIDYEKVDGIEVGYGRSNESIYINTDSVCILKQNLDSNIYQSIPSTIDKYDFDAYGSIIYNNTFASFIQGKIFFYNLETEKIIDTLDFGEEIVITPWYFYQDIDYIYLISYYNNNQISELGYDNVHCYKISKNSRSIVKSKSIDIGKEIVLGPLNYQLIAFNQNQLVIASSIKHELYVLDLNFEPLDTIYLDKKISRKNTKKFNTTFPDNTITNYYGYPKAIVKTYNESGLNNQKTINKILFVDKETLLISYNIKQYKEYQLEYYSIKDRESINEFDIPFSNNMYSNFCWTKRIYNNLDNEIVFVNTIENNGLKYKVSTYEYCDNQVISIRDDLKKVDFDNADIERIDLSKYSGILLVDEFFCKNCYSINGIGEGVLVVKQNNGDTFSNSSMKSQTQKIKRNLNIKGEVVLLDQKNIKRLLKIIKPNTLYPLKS